MSLFSLISFSLVINLVEFCATFGVVMHVSHEFFWYHLFLCITLHNSLNSVYVIMIVLSSSCL